MERCGWVGTDTIYLKYHDHEWGVPEYDSQALWEKLVLDGFQAGLSWITILKKRDAFRSAFVNFDPHIIATCNDVFPSSSILSIISFPNSFIKYGKVVST